MIIALPLSILASPGMTKKEKLRVMKARQSALSETAVDLLSELGYEVGASLKLPGAFAFSALKDGKETRIGIKTSADRFVGIPRDGAGTWGLLSHVDEVFVVTFDARHDPKRLQLIAFDPARLIAMGEKVYAKAQKAGQTGIQWIPLDDQPNSEMTSMAAGPLLPHGEVLVDEAITWLGASSEGMAHAPDLALSDQAIIPAFKASLAAALGVGADSIRITVEV